MPAVSPVPVRPRLVSAPARRSGLGRPLAQVAQISGDERAAGRLQRHSAVERVEHALVQFHRKLGGTLVDGKPLRDIEIRCVFCPSKVG
jgi:hypothetical protein